MINLESKIFIAGHNGMVGKSILNKLKNSGFNNIFTISRKELDLTDQSLVDKYFSDNNFDLVINAAAKVGGINANNSYPYDFLYQNLQIQNNLINSSYKFNVYKFIFLGSSCIYPKLSPQPIKEEYLLTGKLEETNKWYAIAKISGLMMCQAINKQFNKNFICLMPTNLYGPNDNFDLESSHVLPAMIRKFHESKIYGNNKVTLWGDGSPYREFLHVDDLANAVLFSIENELNNTIYNVGFGSDITIHDLAILVKDIINKDSKISWNNSKPNGTPRKLIDSSKLLSLGWKPKIKLKDGIKEVYEWYKENY